jgi:xylulose-5-phosphate/fructose-6-phosphate phosphoketolase
MTLQSADTHPHGLSDIDFDTLFTSDRPVIFAYHGYPHLIHRLIYRRRNQLNFHVHGFEEEGTTTTPFDMLVRNRLDRFHLAIDVIDRVPGLIERAAGMKQHLRDRIVEHERHVCCFGEDMPDIRNWSWTREFAG